MLITSNLLLLRRDCLSDVFDAALAAAGLPFRAEHGIASVFELVVAQRGENSSSCLPEERLVHLTTQVSLNLDADSNGCDNLPRETLQALLYELRTTYAVELCVQLVQQLLRIISSKRLLRKVSSGGLESVVRSMVVVPLVGAGGLSGGGMDSVVRPVLPIVPAAGS